jgi:hypothetical protein
MPVLDPCAFAAGSCEGAITSRTRISPGAEVAGRSRCHAQFALRASNHALPAPTVLVMFADYAGCPWLRGLRRGFRHCFVVMRTDSIWLACEPLKDRIELDALALPDDFDLAAFYHEQGHQVLLGQRPPPKARRRFAVAPLTCVSVVKRLLGIDAPWVWTPWQLYLHLRGPKGGFRPWPEPARPHNASAGRNSALDTAS